MLMRIVLLILPFYMTEKKQENTAYMDEVKKD